MAEISVSFDIYDAETVRILQEEDPGLLPDCSVNAGKDLAYNKKQVTNAITSGIIKGESIPKIASNLQSTMKNLNQRSAISAARTAATSAHNAGKLSTMKELAAMGVEVQKEWVATLDDRTRESHRKLDGERRDLDERFSNGLMYPGASGSSKETWQCRCTMVSYISEYDSNDEPRLTYSEWEKYKEATGSVVTKITKEENNAAKAWSKTNTKIKGEYSSYSGITKYEYDPETDTLTVGHQLAAGTDKYIYQTYEAGTTYYKSYISKFGIQEKIDALLGKQSVQHISPSTTFTYGNETNEWFYNQEEFKTWHGSLTSAQVKNIKRYTGTAYAQLNSLLRYGTANYSEKTVKNEINYAKRIDKIISSYDLPESITALRGLNRGQLQNMLDVAGNTASIDNISSLIGTEIGDAGFGSYTTVALENASDITKAKEVYLYVTTTTGKGVGAYINNMSYYEDCEYEWLMCRDMKFKVDDAYEDGDKIIISASISGKLSK